MPFHHLSPTNSYSSIKAQSNQLHIPAAHTSYQSIQPPFAILSAWSRFFSVFVGPNHCGERISLRGDDTTRTTAAQRPAWRRCGLSLDGKAGLELCCGGKRECGRQRGGCMFGQGVSREEKCLWQLGASKSWGLGSNTWSGQR